MEPTELSMASGSDDAFRRLVRAGRVSDVLHCYQLQLFFSAEPTSLARPALTTYSGGSSEPDA